MLAADAMEGKQLEPSFRSMETRRCFLESLDLSNQNSTGRSDVQHAGYSADASKGCRTASSAAVVSARAPRKGSLPLGAPRRVAATSRPSSGNTSSRQQPRKPGVPSQSRLSQPVDAERPSSSELKRLPHSPVRGAKTRPSNIGTKDRPKPGCDEVPIWEWCRKEYQTPTTSRKISAADWGVYGAEQNAAIEACFVAKKEHACVEVGIRSFQIVFSTKDFGYATQKDIALNKSRLVRRRLVSADACDTAMFPAVKVLQLEQEECAICCIEFAESTTMPVVELSCKHCFHEACALLCRERNEGCPCCRREVDWDSVLPRQDTPRGWKSCRKAAVTGVKKKA